MDFSGLLDGLDASVEAHLCDDALYLPGEGSAGVPVRIMVEFPRPIDRLDRFSIARSRPEMRVLRTTCPGLLEGHRFLHLGAMWAVAEAPSAPDDGRWWVFEVEPA